MKLFYIVFKLFIQPVVLLGLRLFSPWLEEVRRFVSHQSCSLDSDWFLIP